ncbi:hypothetical protein [Mesorhizobium sp. WSM2561]|uniref:hypothetical protein n=1 Tax=Mesorhizobium sp. WSM2561 TaxID=1040985 RepID=UPI0004804BC8|nr:hypothetical protein [Mesorhizobium sp. WSM2561]
MEKGFPRRLRRKDASAYLLTVHGVSRTPKTLAKYAVTGGGPRYHKANNVPFYDTDNLDAWVEELFGEAVSSSAEYKARRAAAEQAA